jgi:hypothetical protein
MIGSVIRMGPPLKISCGLYYHVYYHVYRLLSRFTPFCSAPGSKDFEFPFIPKRLKNNPNHWTTDAGAGTGKVPHAKLLRQVLNRFSDPNRFCASTRADMAYPVLKLFIGGNQDPKTIFPPGKNPVTDTGISLRAFT